MFSLRLGAASALFFAMFGSAAAGSAAYVPGQILVKFKPGAGGAANVAHAAIAAQVTGQVAQIGVQTVKLPSGTSVEQGLKYYRGLSNVAYAEPNFIAQAHYVPNDPRYNEQYMHQMINSPVAWDLTLGNSNVKIAILDSGVDYNHPDLSGKVILGRDWINNDADPMDDNGHGTHCAGIAAAKTNNSVGIAGAGFNCSILAQKVLGAGGSGSFEAITAAITDSADRGADVISMSLGAGASSQAMEDAVAYAWNKGAILTAASGNANSTSKSYPGAIPLVVCVGSTDQNDQRSGFSNYGADWVDVAAPGSGILSTLPGNKYDFADGTSMACPVVSGVLGLMKSYGPQTTNVQLRQALEANCDAVGNWVAKGRVNAAKAVNSIIKPINSEFPVRSIAVYSGQGTRLSGTVAALAKADAQRVTLQSVVVPQVGTVAAVATPLLVTANVSKVRSASVEIQTTVPRGVTIQVHMKNFSTGKYVVLRSATATGSAQVLDVPIPNLAQYVSGTNIDMIVRAFQAPSNSRSSTTYAVNLDVVKVKALVNP